MAFDELYQDIILDHYKHPRNFGEGEPECSVVELDNPVCGDHIRLMLLVDENNIVKDVHFSGSGCAISVASASIMTEEIKGKSLQDAKAIIEEVLQAMRGEKDAEILESHGDLIALKGIMNYPVRIKCATLSWHAVRDAIENWQHKG